MAELNHVPTTGGEETTGEVFGLEGNLFLPVVGSIVLSLVLVPLSLMTGAVAGWSIGKMILLWISPFAITYTLVLIFFNHKPPRYMQDWFENLVDGPHFFHERRGGSLGMAVIGVADVLRKIGLGRILRLGEKDDGIHPFLLASKLARKMVPLIVMGLALAGCRTPPPSETETIYRRTSANDGLVRDPIVVSELVAQVRFSPGSATLEWQALQDLDAAVETIRRYPNPEVVLVGHADDYLDAHKCLRLSKDRAESVCDYLRKQTRAIVARYEGVGDREPVNERRGDPANRRVVIFVKNR